MYSANLHIALERTTFFKNAIKRSNSAEIEEYEKKIRQNRHIVKLHLSKDVLRQYDYFVSTTLPNITPMRPFIVSIDGEEYEVNDEDSILYGIRSIIIYCLQLKLEYQHRLTSKNRKAVCKSKINGKMKEFEKTLGKTYYSYVKDFVNIDMHYNVNIPLIIPMGGNNVIDISKKDLVFLL